MHHVWSWPTLLTVSCMKAKSFKSDSQIQFIYIVLNRRLHIITKTLSIEFPQKSFKNIPNADFVLTVSQYANRSSMLHLKAIKKSSLIRHLQTFTAGLGSLWNIYKSQSPYEQSPLLPSSWLTTWFSWIFLEWILSFPVVGFWLVFWGIRCLISLHFLLRVSTLTLATQYNVRIRDSSQNTHPIWFNPKMLPPQSRRSLQFYILHFNDLLVDLLPVQHF